MNVNSILLNVHWWKMRARDNMHNLGYAQPRLYATKVMRCAIRTLRISMFFCFCASKLTGIDINWLKCPKKQHNCSNLFKTKSQMANMGGGKSYFEYLLIIYYLLDPIVFILFICWMLSIYWWMFIGERCAFATICCLQHILLVGNRTSDSARKQCYAQPSLRRSLVARNQDFTETEIA